MSRFIKSHRYSGINHPNKVAQTVDPLLAAARAASERRNALNYAWTDSDAETLVAHFTRLIHLVGEADTAWRAYRASRGEDYGTLPSNTPLDLGWLPRYTEGLERARSRLAAEQNFEDSGLSQQWLDYPDSDTGGL